jgi:hypothetical protein
MEEAELLERLRELSLRYDWERLFGDTPVLIVHSPPRPSPQFQTPRTPTTNGSFARQRESLTASYYEEFNKIAFQDQLPRDLPVVWNKRMTKSAGFTKMKRYNLSDTPRTALIELSTKVILSNLSPLHDSDRWLIMTNVSG